MLTKYLTNNIYITEQAIQTTRYAIFFPIPCRFQENLPPTSRASRAADTKSLFTFFPVCHAFVHVIEKQRALIG